jgi:hypothetical protein
MRIWHPEVHGLFREILHYYLLVVRPFDASQFAERFDNLLKLQHLAGCCYYPAFGAADVLMRIWLPAGKEAEFQEALENMLDVRHVAPFRVTAILRYWCAQERFREFQRVALESITPDVIRSIQTGGAEKDTVNSYEQKRLFANVPSSDNIKFFIVMRGILSADRVTEESLERSIVDCVEKRAAQDAKEQILRPSLYRGFGFAWGILKAEIARANFFFIGPLMLEISDKLSAQGGFTTTYICCHPTNREDDDISETSLNRALGEDLAVASIVPELYTVQASSAVSRNLRDEIQVWVHNKFLDQDLDEADRETVRRCLSAVVNGDEDAFFDSLLRTFRNLEKFLRSTWPRFIESRGVTNKTEGILRAAGIERAGSPKEMTLGSLLTVCAKTIEIGCGGAVSAQQELTADWEAVAKLRNQVAHGFVNPRAEWQQMLTTFVENAGRLRRLVRVIETSIEGK